MGIWQGERNWTKTKKDKSKGVLRCLTQKHANKILDFITSDLGYSTKTVSIKEVANIEEKGKIKNLKFDRKTNSFIAVKKKKGFSQKFV